MEMKAAAPRCQLLLILVMSVVMLLPGTNGSLLLVQRTVTRTIVLQETIGKEKNICGSKRQTTEEEKEKRKKKCLQGTRTTTKSDFEIFKRMTGSLNDDSTWTKEKESYRTSAIQNLHSFDPFADASKGDDLLPAGTEDYIHIRIQQRNGRKTLTTVQGIADDYDKKKLVKAFKKKFACNGTVIEHPEYGEVIQLQGDQRKNICQFLIEIGLAKDDQLKVHGF
ncbi:hypothetical protein STEG23_020292 [Scotinomys teguina]